MKNNSITHLVLLPIVFFICVPALFVKQNIEEIPKESLGVFAVLLGFAIIALVFLLLANALFRKKYLSFILGNGTEFVCFYVIVAGFIFPVSVSSGLVDIDLIPINFRNLIFALFAAAVMLWVAKGKHGRALYTGIIIYVALNFSVSAVTIFSKFNHYKDKSALTELSTSRNVIVLSLDGVSGSAATEIISEAQSFDSVFKGFTVFDKVTSSSPATSVSTAASLYGNRNYKTLYKTEKEIWDSAPADLLTNKMQDHGFKVSTYGIYNRNFHDASRQYQATIFGGLGIHELLSFTIARIFTGSLVPPGKLLEKLDLFLMFGYEEESNGAKTLVSKIFSSNAPKWKKVHSASYLDLENYIADLQVKNHLPVAHFLHFTFTHYPVEFDRECQFFGDNPDLYRSRQNRFGAQEETYCAVSKFAEFISKLKALGVFEQSLIVLKSDHGKPVSYYEPDTIWAASIRGKLKWGYGRYEPFLAIKDFGPGEFALKTNSSPVMLDDLAYTICLASLDDSVCSHYSGFDILDDNLDIPESATVTLFVPESINSDFQYRTHVAVSVKRQPEILLNLYQKILSETDR